jgi:signal transduction histidine kinase/CheY-like chemotaxis protein
MTVNVQTERDVVLARQRARQLAGLLGFPVQDQTRIATAVSEIARNAHMYAGGGKVDLLVENGAGPQIMTVCVRDHGSGIRNLDAILGGTYRSSTGMGRGLCGSRRLMDGFEIETGERGTTVTLRKTLPPGVPRLDPSRIGALSEHLVRQNSQDVVHEVQQQNQELLGTLDELNRRQHELERLNHELEDTNRGVVALYAELDEKAVFLRRADELKTRFLSDMSHEFRTPLNSIIALSRILEEGTDGPLNAEQQVQVGLVKRSATDLLELVNDLLDLAKVEAGKADVRVSTFRIDDLFGALRGVLRPLQSADSVPLIIDAAEHLPPMTTDEAKVAQVLRNFVANALKFTEKGEVHVSARICQPHSPIPWVRFCVRDSGVGIANTDLDRIFEDFTQIDGPLQGRRKGTGLGLPLTRKLAELLGGRVLVESKVGEGSTFCLEIPTRYRSPSDVVLRAGDLQKLDRTRIPILVVEDNESHRILYASELRESPFQILVADSLSEARAALGAWRPGAIVLDIKMREEEGWDLLQELKANPETASIPVIVATVIDEQEKAKALGASSFGLKPLAPGWLIRELSSLVLPHMEQRSS